jgi:putative endonuclease
LEGCCTNSTPSRIESRCRHHAGPKPRGIRCLETAACGSPPCRAYRPQRSCGRVAEGGGLLNRYRVVKPYRGFESLRLRHPSPYRASGGTPPKTDGRRVSPGAPSGAQGDRCRLWYVYFLELSNGDIYVGSTNDLRRRFSSHQEGSVASTCKYLPVILCSYVAVMDKASARGLGRYFKSGSGKAFAKKRLLRKTKHG